ncbi:MAG: adenylate/guanylate cyclase domain-containing protein [Flavobacteriales bacterium]|nr:adenylate/guanylate cyclase domain-containing protein [Flavobacteriales bacterium]
MALDDHRESPFQRIADIGGTENLVRSEKRYLQASNIAAILGGLFNLIWIFIALSFSEVLSAGINVVLGLMFTLVLYLNKKGKRLSASIWLATSAYCSVLIFLYISGYQSGIASVCFLMIILPYMTFPRKARSLAHVFSFLACLTMIAIVVFQSQFITHSADMDPYVSQVVNIGMTALICFALIWGLSVLVDKSEESLILEQKKSDDLLHNILPANIVKDLKESGSTTPKRHQNVTIQFTDFEGFTELVASIPAITLVSELNDIFGRFDEIMRESGVEKIETVGDAYMAACGLENNSTNHAISCIRAGKKMLAFLEERNMNHEIKWHMRVGIHSGTIVSGVVGKKKFAYALFGDTVNTASRIESAGQSGRINISSSTFNLVKTDFRCEPRGKIFAKGKGEMDMYFVE